jgi:hypothetical protein
VAVYFLLCPSPVSARTSGAAECLALNREREYKNRVQTTPRGCSEAQVFQAFSDARAVSRRPHQGIAGGISRWYHSARR